MTGYQDGYWWSKDNLRLHFRDYPGDAARPPILCLPGLTRNARDFDCVAQFVNGRHRVLCVDFRGRGESAYAKDAMTYVPLTYMQDIDALLAAEGIDRFVAFGTSLGGLVTILLAATQKGRLAGALLNDIGPEIDPRGLERIRGYVGVGRSYETWTHAARSLAETNADIFPRWDLEDWIAYAKRTHRLTNAGKIVLDYDMRIAEPFAVPGGEAGVDLWPALRQLSDIPTLLVRGALSDLLTDQAARKMVGLLDNSELVVVPDIGHAPTLDEPEVRAGIDRLLARIEG